MWSAWFNCFSFSFFVLSDCYMLTSTAYGHCVAICNPLLYKGAMLPKLYVLSYLFHSMEWHLQEPLLRGFILRLTFCNFYVITHSCITICAFSNFLAPALMSIGRNFHSCCFNFTVPTFTILISFIFFLANILNVKFVQGRSKAFSNCSSHIMTISLHFRSGEFM